MADKPRLVLIYGDPSQGKTWLGKQLRDRGFHVLRTDGIYVEFIRERHHPIHFELLPEFVRSHFHHIVQPGEKRRLLKGITAGWIDHIRTLTRQALSDHHRVAVEGWMVKFVLADFRKELASEADLLEVLVRKRTYLMGDRRVTIDEIAG